MEPPKLLQSHGNHCMSCKSLDYEPFEEKLVKKRSIVVETPFTLQKLPLHLLDSVLIKMNYDSFTKFRRTNRSYSGYIDQNRKNLRIAMFHDMSLRIITGDAFFSTKGCPFSNYTYMSIEEEDERSQEKEYENGTIIKQGFPYNLRVRIDQLMNNVPLWKEFSGCFKPYLVHMSAHLMDPLPNNVQDAIKFFQWGKIKNVSFFAWSFEMPVFLQLCAVLKPKTLKLFQMSEIPATFSTLECFKETKAVELMSLNDVIKPQLLKHLEYFCVKNIVLKDSFLEILQSWRCGELTIKEIWMELNTIVSLDCFSPISITKEVAWKYLKRSMTYAEFRQAKNVKHYLVEQENTGTKAYCMINLKKFDRSSGYLVYFNAAQ